MYHREYSRKKRGIVDAHGDSAEGACGICGRFFDQLVLDHDHKTGHIRGWLCNRCNLVLGALEDRDWQQKARQYLEKKESI